MVKEPRMELGLKGKKVFITGAGRGIGRAIALDFAREGAQVAVASRTKSDLERLVKEMGGEKKGHCYVVCDLTKNGSPRKVVQNLWKNFGRIEILINNVGDALGVVDPFCSLSDWHRVFRINFEVAIELTNLLVTDMLNRKWGRIVNIGSTASLENNGPVTYCAAKAALMAYSRSLGRILAPKGIVLSVVLPGAVMTAGGYWNQAVKKRPKHAEKYIHERLPLLRFGRPEEISGMVVFLSSALASFCHGAVVPVDGGQSRHYFGTYNLTD